MRIAVATQPTFVETVLAPDQAATVLLTCRPGIVGLRRPAAEEGHQQEEWKVVVPEDVVAVADGDEFV